MTKPKDAITRISCGQPSAKMRRSKDTADVVIVKIWDGLKVRRTKKQVRRIINNMTNEELESEYARHVLEDGI